MPQERLSMRKIREVLRLKAGGFSKRLIAASLGISATRGIVIPSSFAVFRLTKSLNSCSAGKSPGAIPFVGLLEDQHRLRFRFQQVRSCR